SHQDVDPAGRTAMTVVLRAASAVSDSIVNDFGVYGHGPPQANRAADAGAHGANGVSAREHTGVVPVLSARSLPESDAGIRAAVTRARAAQYEWHLQPLAERNAALTRAAEQMLRD